MKITYTKKTDLLYIRFDERIQPVINKELADDIVIDIGSDNTIVGIEILDASRHVHLEKILPITHEISREAV